jgi:aspartate/methionine/tyrosine aminotransferase
MTGLRLGYIAIRDAKIRDRAKKVLFHTASNISSVVQWGGVGALDGSQACVEEFRAELRARRDLFYAGIREAAGDVFSGEPPAGAFYAFMKINPAWQAPSTGAGQAGASISWQMAEFLIRHAHLGSVPGVDFGRAGEGHLRFCFARDRRELTAALQAIGQALAPARVSRQA